MLSGEIEFNEIDFTVDHKGYPSTTKAANRPTHRRRLKGTRGRGKFANEKPPVFGMIQRSGDIVIQLRENV